MAEAYYQDEWVTIYHGDCREILPLIPDKSIDLVLTDPPYPDQHPEYGDCNISFLADIPCRQLVFWSAKDDFPLDYTAIHIWDKISGYASEYERVFERNGERKYRILKYVSLRMPLIAQMTNDIWGLHPSQKPQKLISMLVSKWSKANDVILDPFLGSGTTCYCAKKLNRRCIKWVKFFTAIFAYPSNFHSHIYIISQLPIKSKYCEIAANRCRQMVMDFSH